jgi:raffinose/stachyose/melibiose transport system permease protein
MTAKIAKNLVHIFVVAIILVPVSIVFLATFKSDLDILIDPLGFPKGFSISNYTELFATSGIGQSILNSVKVTIASVALTLTLASMASYAISRLTKVTGAMLFSLFVLGLTIPAQVNILPIYILFNSLGLTNSHLGLILANLVSALPISVFIITAFFRELPKEMIEAAEIDGASHVRVFARIVMPLSTPAIGATAIFLFVIFWNDLLFPLLLLTQKDLQTLPLTLLGFRGEYSTSYGLLFTGVAVASAPLVIMYLLMQRSFVAGLTSGAVKG